MKHECPGYFPLNDKQWFEMSQCEKQQWKDYWLNEQNSFLCKHCQSLAEEYINKKPLDQL